MLFRTLASAFIVGKCLASGSENDALMQSQSRNEDALEFAPPNKDRVQLSELHKTLLSHHHEYKQVVAEQHREHRGYRAHLTKHRDARTGVKTSERAERIKKTARQMEQEYRSILEMMVAQPALGDEYRPPVEVIDEVSKVFQTMKDQLGIEQETNQNIIEAANAVIKGCNDAKDKGYSTELTGVEARRGEYEQARRDHATCREAENKLICATKKTCDAFNNYDKCGEHTSLGRHEQNWFAKMKDPSVPVKDARESLKTVVEKAAKCRTDLIAEHAKAKECDTAQGVFEGKFCKFAETLQDVSGQYDTCYSAANHSRYEVKEPAIKQMEADGKIILTMLKKIDCYLATLKNVQYTSQLPVQGDLNACVELVPTTTELDVDYITPEPKADLSADLYLIRHWPSEPDNGFAAEEYGNTTLFHDDCKKADADVPAFQAALHPTKLQEVKVCTTVA